MYKIRVGVLMGGRSIEREVSFNSGRTVCDHLDTSRYAVVPIFQTAHGQLYLLPLHFLHRGKISDFEHRLAQEATAISWDSLKEIIDFAYICMHGRQAEDGVLQGFLEVLNIPYLGSGILASALSMDKIIQKEFLIPHGIQVPASIALLKEDIPSYTAQQIGTLLANKDIAFPCVVKPAHEGSSLGVSIVFQEQDLYDAVQKAFHADPSTVQDILVEEKIEGMEFSCTVLTDYKNGCLIPLPPTEIVIEAGTDFFNYEQKYMPGKAHKFTPPRCSQAIIKKIQDTCVRVATVLGITNIARVGGFVTKDGNVIITDPNPLSGMNPTSFLFREAAEINMSHTQLINHLIETELHTCKMLNTMIQEQKKDSLIATPKIRVAVLMGGASNEKEISLESGRNVFYKLSPHRYESSAVFVDSSMRLFIINQSLLVRSSTKEISSLVTPQMEIKWNDLPSIADFVFIGLHGGSGENGGVQGTLEMLGIPYNGSGVFASALCMDKYKANQFLKTRGFAVPNGLLISKDAWLTAQDESLRMITDTINWPCIAKPHDDGCSVMVQKINDLASLKTSIDYIFSQQKDAVLIEEFIKGMELTVGVIGNHAPRALPPSQAVTAGDILSIEEKFLPGAGENQTPAALPTHTLSFVQDTIARAYKAVGCHGYARIDCFYQTAQQSPTEEERVVILEINTLPGLTPATCIFHQAAEIGMCPMNFIDEIINYGLELHRGVVRSEIQHHQER